MTSSGKIHRDRFKDVFLGKIPHKELTKDEKFFYLIYVWGITDGREIAILEALSKIDPEKANELTANFVGDDLSKLLEEAENVQKTE